MEANKLDREIVGINLSNQLIKIFEKKNVLCAKLKQASCMNISIFTATLDLRYRRISKHKLGDGVSPNI